MRETLNLALRHALAYREAEDHAPVAAHTPPSALVARLNVPLLDQPTPASTVIDDLVAAVAGGLHNTTGGRFFGWVIGGSLPSALAADWLTSAWDQNAGAYAVAPAAAIAEDVAGQWLKDLLHLPPEASFALVTGCQMAHATCLAAARHNLLAARGYDVEHDGLFGAPPIRILTSTELHGTISRAARLLGFGERSLTLLPCDAAGRLPENTLQAALAADPSVPTIVRRLRRLRNPHPAGPKTQRMGSHRRRLRSLDRRLPTPRPPHPRRRAGRLLGHRRPQMAQRSLRLRIRLHPPPASPPRRLRAPRSLRPAGHTNPRRS
jgi:hypothetical protein